MSTLFSPQSPGEAVRRCRLLAGLTQQGLARRLDRSQAWVSKVENGTVVLDRISVLNEVAAVLGVHPRDLLDADGIADLESTRAGAAARGVIEELRRYDLPVDPERVPRDVDVRLGLVHAARDRADYFGMLTALAPVLLGARAGLHAGTSTARERAAVTYTVACKAAHTAGHAVGNRELVALACSGAAWAAACASPAEKALAASLRARDMWSAAAWADATVLVDAAVLALEDDVTRAEPGALHVAGTLHLRAAVTAARSGDLSGAVVRLDEAARIAALLGGASKDVHSTTFCAANVAIHRLSATIEACDVGAALTLAGDAKHLAAVATAPLCRRAHHELDLTGAYLWAGHRAQALNHLEKADRLASQLVRHHPVARAMLRRIIDAERAPATQRLHRLATNFHII
ncbi:MAG: hypothetical protein QG608_1906 [Actinomycetota bacterium]|nr:hypothetical protein [Actinomycetota bacterium]